MTRTTTWVALAATLVAPSLIPAHADAQATAKAPVEVPLQLRGGRMVVPVRSADGTDLTFLVSTGTAVTVLSESTARRVGDQVLSLGGVPLNMEQHQTLPDDRLTFDGVKADGMVGNNTLNNFDNLFDVPGGRLVLKPFGRAVEWPGMTLSAPVPLRILHGVVIALDVEVNGKPFPAMLELGATALLSNQAVLDDAGISGKAVTALKVGASTFRDVPIRLSDHPVIARFSPTGAGFVLLGAPLAWDCAISVSWIHQEMRTCVR